MKVLNFGSMNIDNVYTVDHMVVPGETQASLGMNIFCGGKGLNQSVALAKAGAEVYHAGMVGEDGEVLLEALWNAGVNAGYVKKIPGRSGHTVIQVDHNGQNSILLYYGANGEITSGYVDEVLSHFGKGDMLLLQNEVNLLDYIIDQAYGKGMTIVLNPSPYDRRLEVCDFNKVSLFILNEIEGSQITGETQTSGILLKFKEEYPNAQVLLTLGQEGSVYQYKDQQYRQGIYQVKVVDTTAAGDTYTGYFIASLMEGLSIPESMDRAAKASAMAVSKKGAAPSIPLKKEVLEEISMQICSLVSGWTQ